MNDKILIDKSKLYALLEYINQVLEFVDVEDEENVSLVKDGYDEFADPIYKLLESSAEIHTNFDAVRTLPIEEVAKILGDANFCFDKCVEDKVGKYFVDGRCQCHLCWREYLETAYKKS